MSDVSGWQTFLQALGYFLKMFFGSAALGTLTGLISALISFFNFGDMHEYIGELQHSISIFLSHLLQHFLGVFLIRHYFVG